jgi:RNA-binding protein
MLPMTDAHDQPVSARAAPALTARERAALKARAHPLEPLIRIGHAGVTDAAVAAIDRALEAHELIKVKLGEGERDDRNEMRTAITARTGAALVQSVGRVIVLWRPRPDEPPLKS